MYILSNERMGLSFTIAAGPRQHSQSHACPAGLKITFYSLSFETPPTWRARSMEQGGGVTPPCTGLPFRRLYDSPEPVLDLLPGTLLH
jgi:hypothetical protein